MRHESFIYAHLFPLMPPLSIFFFLRRDSFVCASWFIYTYKMTQSYVQCDAFIHVTWRIHTGGMTRSYMGNDSLIHATWRIHTCDMTHSYMGTFPCSPPLPCSSAPFWVTEGGAGGSCSTSSVRRWARVCIMDVRESIDRLRVGAPCVWSHMYG